MRSRTAIAAAPLVVLSLACALPLPEDDAPPPPRPIAARAEPSAPVPPVATPPVPTPAPAIPPAPAPVPIVQPWVAALTERRAVQHAGEEYLLAHHVANEQGSVDEYIRPHETLQRWTRLLAVRRHLLENDPRVAAQRLAEDLQAQSPPRPHRVMVGDEGQYMVEFTTWDDQVVEINVFIYRRDPSGRGLVSHQGAVRSYVPDTSAFIAALEAERDALRDRVLTFEFPGPVQ